MHQDDITRLLRGLRQGSEEAASSLFDLIYHELKRIASHILRNERFDHTLQTTALVHEVYLRVIGNADIDWKDRGHFFAVAANAMRRILVDYARTRRSEKRGGQNDIVPLTGLEAMLDQRGDQILLIDSALDELGRLAPRQKTVVEMRFFAGFTEEEIAAFLEITPRTVKRDWSAARAFLRLRMEGSTAHE